MQGRSDMGAFRYGLTWRVAPLVARAAVVLRRSFPPSRPCALASRPYGVGLGALSRSLAPCTPLRAHFGERLAMCSRGAQWGTLAGRGGVPPPPAALSPHCAPPAAPSATRPHISTPMHSAAIPSLPMLLNISKCSPALLFITFILSHNWRNRAPAPLPPLAHIIL